MYNSYFSTMATATKWANHKITTLQRQSNQRLMKCACKTPCFYCNRPWNLIRTTWCWSLCLFDFAFVVFWLCYVFISYNKHFVKWSWFELREYRWIGDVIIAVVIAIYAIANFCLDIFRYWFFHSFLHGFVHVPFTCFTDHSSLHATLKPSLRN